MRTGFDKTRIPAGAARDELLLHAYLDGELPPEAAAEWQRRVAAEPELARRCEEILALRRLVQADSAALPRYPGPPPREAALADAALPPSRAAWRRAAQPVLICLRDAFRLSLSPAWARAAAAGIALFAAAWMGVRLAPAPDSAPVVAAATDGVDILSVELPQAGTGVCTVQVPDGSLTILWVTGLTTPAFGGPETTDGTPS